MIWTDEHYRLVEWAADECARQRSGERSVARMVEATVFCIGRWKGDPHIDEGAILILGHIVEPDLNRQGYRETNVRVGMDKMAPWEEVPRLMVQLVANQHNPSVNEFYKAFEEIHPFRDGNGRVGKLIWSWMSGYFGEPLFFGQPPNYWR